MDKFFRKTQKMIFYKQKDIFSSALVLSTMIIISRVFGFIRYRTLATYFSKEELDIFFASFRIPDFVFEILITGALTSALIPLFIKYEKDKLELNKKISSILNFVIFGMFFFIVVTIIFADSILPLLIPGFSPSATKSVIFYSRILLATQLPFLVIGNILSGVAQSNKIFIITAIAPILYNLGIILGTIIFANNLWILGPIFGVIIGSILFVLVQIPTIFIVDFKYSFFKFDKSALKEFSTLFLPRLFTTLTNQIDLTIDLVLSTLLGPGSYTIFFFAQHLQLFPVSLVGMAFGQASLPYLSDLYKENKITEIKKIFVDSILQLFYIAIPLSLFFIFARTPIVRLFFGGVKFDWEGTTSTALTLSIFCIALPFHTIFYFISRAFYAIFDSKTPFIINLFSVLINTFLSLYFIFINKWPVWSLALSFSISVTINVLIMLIFFYKKINGYNFKKLLINSVKIYSISIVSAFISYELMKILDKLILDTTRTINIVVLLTIVFSCFTAIYLFLSWLLTIEEVYMLSNLFTKIKQIKNKIAEIYTDNN